MLQPLLAPERPCTSHGTCIYSQLAGFVGPSSRTVYISENPSVGKPLVELPPMFAYSNS